MESCTENAGVPDPAQPPDPTAHQATTHSRNSGATIDTSANLDVSLIDVSSSSINITPDEASAAAAALPKVANTTTNGRKTRKRKRNNLQQQLQQQQHVINNNNKKWPKQHKLRQLLIQQQPIQQSQQQQSQQNNNNKQPDLENIPCSKNIGSNNRNKHVYGLKAGKTNFKGNVHRSHGTMVGGVGGGLGNGVNAISAAKFFLPNDKRCRKELIIPPTKFLLGGNISDPLNLNSLQDEALNASMNAATPKSSPITTPPKMDVLVVPNSYDPLHLMEAIDTEKYEKLVISPLKQRKPKHRNRKKKTKKRSDSPSSTMSTTTESIMGAAGGIDESGDLFVNTDDENCSVDDISVGSSKKRDSMDAKKEGAGVDKERCSRDLRLDLSADNSTSSVLSAGRKRKVSESTASGSKVKVRRMESMDKIVSPVIPQPGGWKRPPLVLPAGAPRNRSRLPSSSIAESDIPCCSNEDLPTPDTLSDMANSMPDIPVTAAAVTLPAIPSQSVQPESLIPANTTSNPSEAQPKMLPLTAKYQFGNYNRYFGFNSLDESSDVRLKIFMQNSYLFRGKTMLDIGCNVGHMTVAVAKKLQPKTIVGIDIDSHLIARARHNLSLYVKLPAETSSDQIQSVSEVHGRSTRSRNQSNNMMFHQNRRFKDQHNDYYPISFPICYGGIPNGRQSNKSDSDHQDATTSTNTTTDTRTSTVTVDKPISTYEQFPHNVFFKTMNYATTDESQLIVDTQQYDLILCLSVTKWLHLNYGDAGLKAAFRRMFNQLQPGGKLVLEAQNWASYKKKKKLTQTIYDNYKSIEFFPNSFHEYLLSPEVGFSHSYTLGIPRHLSKGFRRPIQLYVKGDFTPSQICWSDNYQPQTPLYDHYPRDPYYDNSNQRPAPFINGFRGGNGGRSAASSSVHANGTRSTPYRSIREVGGPYSQHYHPYTPLNGLPYTSQYYNPMETDSYLPSYDNEVQVRHYCFASPLYSTVWSPPSSSAGGGGRRSASNTPLFGSIRRMEDDQYGNNSRRHVYLPSGYDVAGAGRDIDDNSRSPQMQYSYAAGSGGAYGGNAGAGTPSGAGGSSLREAEITGNSPRSHVYVTAHSGNVGDNSSSPIQQYSGESSRSVEAEEEF